MVSDALIEAVDMVPTFLDALEIEIPDHSIEGRSILPLLRGEQSAIREAVFSELDFAIYPTARKLGLKPNDARMVMCRTARWKLVHFGPGLPPQLFDMQEDPLELHDRGRDDGAIYRAARDDLYQCMLEWMRQRRNRSGMTNQAVARRPSPAAAGGVTIGVW